MQHLIFGLICGGLLGFMFGWAHAHLTVATECQRLGKFYVGKTVYECTAIVQPDRQGKKPD